MRALDTTLPEVLDTWKKRLTLDVLCSTTEDGGSTPIGRGYEKSLILRTAVPYNGGFLKWWSQMSQKKTPQIDHF